MWKLLAFSTAVGLLIMELGLRLIYPAPSDWREPQVRFYASDLLEHVLIPGSTGFSVDAAVSVNRLGLRDDEFDYRKPPGAIRVLALGDSFTFGMGVEQAEAWPEQLEDMLGAAFPDQAVQVINAGVSGYTTRQELIYLLSEGFEFEPDLIVVGFYWNDLIYNDRPMPDLSLPRVPDDPRMTSEDTAHALPGPIRNLLRKSRLLYVLNIRRQAIQAWLNPPDLPYVNVQRALLAGDETDLDPYWDATAAKLLAMADAGREFGVPVVLVHLPMENQIRFDFPALRTVQRLQAIWAPTGMRFVDTEPGFEERMARGENPFLPYDLHPNSVGMEVIAESVFGAILADELLAPETIMPEDAAAPRRLP